MHPEAIRTGDRKEAIKAKPVRCYLLRGSSESRQHRNLLCICPVRTMVILYSVTNEPADGPAVISVGSPKTCTQGSSFNAMISYARVPAAAERLSAC
jgi:hypothetical protein